MLIIIILGLILGFIVVMIALITDSNQKQQQENVERSIKKMREFVSKWNPKNDPDYEERKNEAIKRVKKEIHDSKFHNTLINIAKSNIDNDYYLSKEDMQFRRDFIEKYLFNSEELKLCGNNHLASLKESCKDFFYDDINNNDNIELEKLEYMNYLFFMALDIFLKNPKNKKTAKSYLKEFVKENMDSRLDSNLYFGYYIYYPIDIFYTVKESIINGYNNIFKPFKPKININDIRVDLLKGAVERKYEKVSFSDNLCFECFRKIYRDFINDVEYYIAELFSNEFVRLEKEATIKNKYQKKEMNKRLSRGRMLRRSKREAFTMITKRRKNKCR